MFHLTAVAGMKLYDAKVNQGISEICKFGSVPHCGLNVHVEVDGTSYHVYYEVTNGFTGKVLKRFSEFHSEALARADEDCIRRCIARNTVVKEVEHIELEPIDDGKYIIKGVRAFDDIDGYVIVDVVNWRCFETSTFSTIDLTYAKLRAEGVKCEA